MTRRAENLETHKGQMAFPGGMRDAQDLDGIATALRETREEVGIPESQVEPVGVLPELWTVTGFLVTPVLGVLKEPIEQVPLIPNLEELDRVFWIPLSVLRREGVYRRESLEFGAVRYPVDVFLVDEYRIWGATGTLLKNLLDRLEGRLEGRLGA
jgi:8-oxo-dGTP pyrophosphatase MutT (NUDIX family)